MLNWFENVMVVSVCSQHFLLRFVLNWVESVVTVGTGFELKLLRPLYGVTHFALSSNAGKL